MLKHMDKENTALAKAINTMSETCAPGIEKFGEMAKDVNHIREQLDGEEEKANRATLAHVCPPLLDEVTLLRKELNRIGSRLNEEEGGGQDASAAEEEPGAGPPSPRAKATSHLTDSTAASRAKASPPRRPAVPETLHPYARSANPKKKGKSRMAEENGVPIGMGGMGSEFHTDDDDNDTPSSYLSWWPSGRASAQSAPGSP
jgi:hypothetical protein